MLDYPKTQSIPLTTENGVIRVAGSRIGLDIIVEEYKSGLSAEEIQYNYPSLSLAKIYAVITYYLENMDDVERYVGELYNRGEAIRKSTEKQYEYEGIRKRLIDENLS